MHGIAGRLRAGRAGELLPALRGSAHASSQVVVTFLALLEMVKLRLVRISPGRGGEGHLGDAGCAAPLESGTRRRSTSVNTPEKPGQPAERPGSAVALQRGRGRRPWPPRPADAELEDVEPADIDEQPVEPEPFEKLVQRARATDPRARPHRGQSAPLRHRQAADDRPAARGHRHREGAARGGAGAARRHPPRRRQRHGAHRGGRRVAAPHAPRTVGGVRAPLPPGEAAAAHPGGPGDAGHHRLPAAGHPAGDRGRARRGLGRGGQGPARAAADRRSSARRTRSAGPSSTAPPASSSSSSR